MLTVKFPRPKNLQALFARATSDAHENDVSWTGDINRGHGSGWGFEGGYTVDENYITVNVTKKPLWVTNARIEKEVRKYLLQDE